MPKAGDIKELWKIRNNNNPYALMLHCTLIHSGTHKRTALSHGVACVSAPPLPEQRKPNTTQPLTAYSTLQQNMAEHQIFDLLHLFDDGALA